MKKMLFLRFFRPKGIEISSVTKSSVTQLQRVQLQGSDVPYQNYKDNFLLIYSGCELKLFSIFVPSYNITIADYSVTNYLFQVLIFLANKDLLLKIKYNQTTV